VTKKARITGVRINLRSEPEVSHKAVNQVSEPMEVYLVEERKDGWCRIELSDSRQYYIWGAYILTTSDRFNRLECVHDTNTFMQPDRKATKITSVKKGDKLLTRQDSKLGNWHPILMPDGKEGWILDERVRIMQ